MRGWARPALLGSLALALTPAAGASASPSAALHASLRAGALTVALRVTDPDAEGAVPPPLRRLVVRLPAGLGVRLDGVATCAPVALRRHGARGCPPAARVGAGHATVEVHAGSQTIPEAVRLSAFRGPTIGGRPALEILGQGSTPLEQRSVSRGILLPDAAPFGSRLEISVPPIPTLELEPDASFVSLSLTIGAVAGSHARIVAPRRCAGARSPFVVELGFADGSRALASTSVPCA
jgi:hypothetical protein